MNIKQPIRRADDPVSWLHALLSVRPSGVTLGDVCCSDAEVEQLRTLLHGRSPHSRAEWMCFAIYAVEWFRRHFDGGEWSWTGVLSALGLPTDFQFCYDALENALERGWGVEVFETETGRKFLATVLLQAMPPLVLVSQRGALGRQLPRLIRAAADGASSARLIELAGEQLDELPVAWRSEEALTLLASMASRLLAAEPDSWGAALDPALRQALVGVRGRGPVIRVRQLIRIDEGGAAWRRELVCPDVLVAADLTRLFGCSELPLAPQWQLYLRNHEGHVAQFGVVTHAAGPAGPLRCSREPLNPALLDAEPLVVWAQAGHTTLGPLALGEQRRGPLPWVFRPIVDAAATWEFVGEGNVRLESPRVLVAVAPEAELQVRGTSRRVGTIEDRVLVECTGKLVVRLGSSRCEIEAGAVRDSIVSYAFDGDCLDDAIAGRPVFRGRPTLLESRDGYQRRVPIEALRWRARGHGEWRDDFHRAVGRVDVRYLQNGAVLWQTSARIVPSGFDVAVVSLAPGASSLTVVGTDSSVVVELDSELPHTKVAEHTWRIDHPEVARPVVVLRVRWPDRGSLRLRCRLPAAPLTFQTTTGAVLEDGADIGLDELFGVRAIACGRNRAHARLVLRARVGQTTMEFIQHLDRHGCLELLRVRDLLRLALTAELCIEAGVRVVLEDGTHRRKLMVRRWARRLRVEAGRVTAWQRSEQVRADQLARIRLEAHSFINPKRRIALVAIGDAFVLPELPESPMLLIAWELRAGRARAWARPLACGRSGISESLQKMLTEQIVGVECSAVQNAAPAIDTVRAETELSSALRQPSKRERCLAIDRALEPLMHDTTHPDWQILRDYVEVLGDVHAATFDLFERVIRRPVLAAAMLLSARNQDFDRMWLAFDELPFAWDLIGIYEWLDAARLVMAGWRATEGQLGDELLMGHFERTAALAVRRSRTAALVFPYLIAGLFGRMEFFVQLELVATGLTATLLDEREQAMQRLLRAVERWPDAPEVSLLAEHVWQQHAELRDLIPRPPDGCGFRGPLLAAPAIAALLVVAPQRIDVWGDGRICDRVKLLTELRLLEAGYADWYGECLSLTLQLAAARCRDELRESVHG